MTHPPRKCGAGSLYQEVAHSADTLEFPLERPADLEIGLLWFRCRETVQDNCRQGLRFVDDNGRGKMRVDRVGQRFLTRGESER